jgi:hypothetical protein
VPPLDLIRVFLKVALSPFPALLGRCNNYTALRFWLILVLETDYLQCTVDLLIPARSFTPAVLRSAFRIEQPLPAPEDPNEAFVDIANEVLGRILHAGERRNALEGAHRLSG